MHDGRFFGRHARYIGHSERRSLYYETDEDINKKIKKVIENDMTPVFCVGETKEEYERGDVYDVLSWQLAGGLDGVSAKDVENMIIAYEPVWAIGTGLTATPAIAQSVHKLIRNWIAEKYSKSVADRVRIQYGGSVKPDSVDELMQCPDIDGGLVGITLSQRRGVRAGQERLIRGAVDPGESFLDGAHWWRGFFCC